MRAIADISPSETTHIAGEPVDIFGHSRIGHDLVDGFSGHQCLP